MKKFARILTVAVMAALALFLVSCSSYNKILKAYEKEGYEEVKAEDNALVRTLNNTLQGVLNAASDKEESDVKITIHFLVNSQNLIPDVACILEFSGSKELYDYIEKNDSLKNMLGEAQNSDFINDNCILFPSSSASLEIFKNA